MNSKLALTLVASSLLLAGCGDNSERTGAETNTNFEAVINTSLKQPSKINFTLSGGDAAIPLPSFLLLDTRDATLNIPLDYASSKQLDDPKVAMGDADGWSTIMPFSIDLKLEGSTTLKNDVVSSLSPQLIAGVVVAEVNYDPTTGVLSFVSQLESFNGTNPATANYVVTPNSDLKGFKITPMNGGLKPNTNYIYALSDSIMDSNDKKLGMSQSYALLKTKLVDQAGTLDKPQLITQQVEKIFDDQSIVNTDAIIYSSWFTTASTSTTQEAVKSAYVKTIEPPTPLTPSQLWSGSANPNNVAASAIDAMLAFTQTDTTGVALETEISNDPGDYFRRVFDDPSLTTAEEDTNFSNAKAAITAQLTGLDTAGYKLKVFKGTVSLPHFLSRDLSDLAFSKTPMRSGMPSIALVLDTLSNGSEANKAKLGLDLQTAGIDPTKLVSDQAEQLKLIGQSFTLAEGGQLDSQRVLTKYSPFPQLRSVENVNYILIMPELSGNIEDDIPVMIYQHGITNRKESLYNFATNYALTALAQSKKPFALIAIDQPLHGQRGLAGGSIVTTPDNATIFMNLKYLPVARDNIRQGSLDGLGLRFAMNTLATHSNSVLKKIDASKVSLLGHSIGGITGIGTSAVANKSVEPTFIDPKFAFNATTLANAGGGIAPFLLESGSFKYTIQHNVLLSLPDYASYYTTTCVPASTAGEACIQSYLVSIAADASKLQAVSATLSGFMYAAQTVLSPVDPVNVATLATGATLGIQSEDDQTIPNTTVIPSAGTYPLLKSRLALSTVSADITPGAADIRVASYYAKASNAGHSSITLPGGGVTAEMHKQVVSFTTSEGKGLVAGDTNMLDTTK